MTSLSMCVDSNRELIGVDDVRTPYWASVDGMVAAASMLQIAKSVPRVLLFVTRRAWRASAGLTVLSFAAQLLSGVVTAFGLLAARDVFSGLLEQGPSPQRITAALPALLLVSTAYAAHALLETAVGFLRGVLLPRVEQAARTELHAAVLDVDLAAFDDADFTESLDNAAGDGLTQLRHATTEIGDLVASVVTMLAAVTSVAILHPALAPLVFLAALAQGWASAKSANLAYESFLRMTSNARRLAVAGDLVTNRRDAAEIRAFTAQDVLLAEYERIGGRLAAESLELEVRKTRVMLLGRFLAGVGTAAGFATLALLVYDNRIPLALAGAAVLALRTASTAVRDTVNTTNMIYESSFYLNIYRGFLLDARNRIRVGTGQRQLGQSVKRIDLSSVCFTYPGQASPALKNVSLTLHSGQVVALVGENGSGKSTLAKILCGLYLPSAGSVMWDDVDISTADPRELHSQTTVILQDPVRWPMTAENNIRIGRLEEADSGRGRLNRVVAHSGAQDVIDSLPEGYRTILSRRFQNGSDLSGGQWQRIGVARALYREAPLLVADEPTAALDAFAEREVFRVLCDAPDRITVLVTHRLVNVRDADLIVVLEKGEVVEHGTHDQLMAMRSSYFDLFAAQSCASEDLDSRGHSATRGKGAAAATVL